MKRRSLVAVFVTLIAVAPAHDPGRPIPLRVPRLHGRRRPTLADYRQITAYFQALDAASPRVEVAGPRQDDARRGHDHGGHLVRGEPQEPGAASRRSPGSSPTRAGSRTPRSRSSCSEGKVVLLVTCNIHASEIGATRWPWNGPTRWPPPTTPRRSAASTNVVLLLVPSLNPDGQIMETEWYRKHLGTRYEGGRMPWLYHHYVGHDNNRDWFMLTQKETQARDPRRLPRVVPAGLARRAPDGRRPGRASSCRPTPSRSTPTSIRWSGARSTSSARTWRCAWSRPARAASSTASIYDAYWPGGTKNTAWWKNVSGLLTEVASARLATPVEHRRRASCAGGRKGLVEYGPQTNFPNPWPGGSGGCATSWTTSASPPTRCSRPARSTARTSCATWRRGPGRRSPPFGPQDAYRIPMRASATGRRAAAWPRSWPSTASR